MASNSIENRYKKSEQSSEKNVQKKGLESQPNNPLHGVKLASVLDFLVDKYGWEKLSEKVRINCFKSNPTKKSSLIFLRKTQWARDKVEELYLRSIRKK